MTQTKTTEIAALLRRAENAHGEYETTVLNGVYDQNWPRWYAPYIIAHGLNLFLGRNLEVQELSQFLADNFEEYKKANSGLEWAEYTARQILTTFA